VASIPLEAIRETLRVQESDIAPSSEGDSILHQSQVVPIRELGDALGRATSRGGRAARSAVIVHAGAKVAAVVVDRVLGTANIVMRSLPPYLAADPVVAGVSLDADGNPQLVLDPAGLVANARASGRSERAAPKKERLPILVIDDSLTTRMLEKSILESAGYWVEVATSAEEGLVKARERRHALFLCDVEMPGMDGFTFVGQTRADPALRETPAILVTSRNAPEDKKRGETAGASAYIVKSEFDQVRLLQIIRSLVE
jgi:two-component system chemotaxis sensor kinase CheA